MDQRGFLFVLPRLGLPDPQGDWQVVKAAIGIRAEVMPVVVNSEIPTPLHAPVAFQDTAFAPVQIGGVMWALSLVRPQSALRTAAPEFFSLSVKRSPAGAVDLPATPLPSSTEWVFVPMHVYTEQMAMVSFPFGPLVEPRRPLYGYGTAEHVRKWQAYSERAGRDVTEEEAAEGDIINSEWDTPIHRNLVLAAARRGDRSLTTTAQLFTLLRAHPAADGDFRGLDYCMVRTDRPMTKPIGEDRWQPLPPEATRADGERKFVNLVRMLVGKAAFSKEEWPRMRAVQPQQQWASGSGMAGT